MESVSRDIVPILLILGRVTAFFAVLPVFSWPTVPGVVRVGIALVLVYLLATVIPAPMDVLPQTWLETSILMVREVITGLGLGLAVALVFRSVQQGGAILHTQTGAADSEIIDPTTGEEEQAFALILETAFMVFFLTVGGHHWLLRIIARSYDVFPIGQTPSPEAMGTAILSASVLMLTLALKLAAPILAAFLVLAVILAILSRLIPEMNVMMASFPLRMGLGMFLAAAILPSLNAFTSELADWMNRFPAT